MCRSVYCPPGGFLSGFRCQQLIKTVAGVPILLKLKITADAGGVSPLSESQASQFRKTLKRALQNSIGHVTAWIIALFHQSNASKHYHVYLVLVRSEYGHDTKQTIKPLLEFLDGRKYLLVTWHKTKFTVNLIRKMLILTGDNFTAQPVMAIDLEAQLELNLTYAHILEILEQMRANCLSGNGFCFIFQELSPLLFCRQVELTEREFTESNGMLTITNTSLVLSVPDYFLSGPNQTRICVDQYLKSLKTSSGTTNIKGTRLAIFFNGVAFMLNRIKH